MVTKLLVKSSSSKLFISQIRNLNKCIIFIYSILNIFIIFLFIFYDEISQFQVIIRSLLYYGQKEFLQIRCKSKDDLILHIIELILAHLFNPIKEYGSYSYLLKTREKVRMNVVFCVSPSTSKVSLEMNPEHYQYLYLKLIILMV